MEETGDKMVMGSGRFRPPIHSHVPVQGNGGGGGGGLSIEGLNSLVSVT